MSFPWQILVLLTILWVFLLSTNPQVFSHLKNMLPRSYNVPIWWTAIYFRHSLNLSEIRLFWSSSCWSYSFLQCIRCSLVSLLHHTWHSIWISTIYLYIHDPRELHLQALKQILCYLCGTLHHVLQLHISPTLRCWLLWCRLVGMPVTKHFTSSYCIFLGNKLISWSSKRQAPYPDPIQRQNTVALPKLL